MYAQSAAELAVAQASANASRTAGRPVHAEPAAASLVGTCCVEAAAHARCDLRMKDAYGADVEELTVLVRAGHVMNVSLRYPKEALDWMRLASFRAATRLSMLWDPARISQPRRIWPDSTYLEPMPVPTLKLPRQRAIPTLAQHFMVPAAEREALAESFHALLSIEDPPWAPIDRPERAWHGERLSRNTSDPTLLGLFEQGLADVWSTHDLRGFALMSAMALQHGAA
jgi:hypothetical protein